MGERRDGDWDCPDCGELVFAYRDSCFKCSAGAGSSKGRSKGSKGKERREGDWDCPECGAHNYNKRDTCFKCDAAKDAGGGVEDEEGADVSEFPEDYLEDEEDGRKSKGQQERREGDWDCPDCGKLVFASRDTCLFCDRAEQADKERRPKSGKGKGNSKGAAKGADKGAAKKKPKEKKRREGDWDCATCGALNFRFRETCFECEAAQDDQPAQEVGSYSESVVTAAPRNELDASAAIRTLSKLSPQFKKSWVVYCRTMEQGSSDPSKCDASFITQFANYTADVLQVDMGVKEDSPAPLAAPTTAPKRPAEPAKAPAKAPPAKKRLTIKKSIADRVAALNAAGGLAAELRLGAVAAPLAALEEASALEVLGLLEEQKGEVEDPNEFVRIQADFMRSGAAADGS
eukprot:gb/GFBE01010304.1/.p1 GENE.gb/GFBE01010304.1/~~gb/GFBE01010304.1/.p1  ORF type:complete len:402 (+),score=106.71 gb/GFBE01010304.1/:1-1206(+)